MKKIVILIFLTLGLYAQDTCAGGIDSHCIKMFTEHYPPYNMKNINGKLMGSSVEVLDAVLKEMKSTQTIKDVKLRSWSKSYKIAKKRKNSMVFSTTRTASREDLFKWVGPIATTTVGVLALKSKKIVINKTSDFNKYKIGVVLDDVGEALLLESGVDKNHFSYVKGEDAINISFANLENNRIDMFVYNLNVAFANAKMEGFDISKYEIIFTLKVGELYFAFNKQTDDAVIQKWQSALDKIKTDGIYRKIQSKYK